MTYLPPEFEPPTRGQLVGDFLGAFARTTGWVVVGLVLGALMRWVIG